MPSAWSGGTGKMNLVSGEFEQHGAQASSEAVLRKGLARTTTTERFAQPDASVSFNHAQGDDEFSFERLASIELKRKLGLQPVSKPSKPRRAPQTADERKPLKADVDASLNSISRIEMQAGPTLAKEITKAKTAQATSGLGKARQDAIVRRKAHRKGLLQLLQCETHHDYPHKVTDRSRLYVETMLRISANIAAIEGSSWDTTSPWFEKRLPLMVRQIGDDQMRSDFDRYLAEAALALAGRIQGGADSFILEPRPRTIAGALQLTIAQLRHAEANGCGLAAIDTPSKNERDRERKERERRTKGMVPQSERTKTTTLKALAAKHGCSLRTLQRREQDGTLETYLAERTGDVAKVSAA